MVGALGRLRCGLCQCGTRREDPGAVPGSANSRNASHSCTRHFSGDCVHPASGRPWIARFMHMYMNRTAVRRTHCLGYSPASVAQIHPTSPTSANPHHSCLTPTPTLSLHTHGQSVGSQSVVGAVVSEGPGAEVSTAARSPTSLVASLRQRRETLTSN